MLQRIVAIGHTHGAYEKGYDNDNFSPQDKEVSRSRGLQIYVATPLGYLKKYNPKKDKVTVVYKKLPYDKNHPQRK